MSAPVTLRGMAWDHPRARNPLEAISAAWSKERKASVEWDARPLKDFEDQPLEELATAYDLVLLDYPFVGFAATSGLIAPVNEWAGATYLADQAVHSAGPSYSSYTWAGKQWALAIDAACQVSAVRDDLWTATQLGSVPDTWQQITELARALRAEQAKVAIPLNPNHAYCAFLSVGVGIAGASFWRAGAPVDRDAARESLESLRRLAKHLHPASRSDDPIAISERMSRTSGIAYVPLMFGYSSYSRHDFRPHTLRFLDAPRGASGARGSVLGGVGLALSSRSSNRDAAAELAQLIAAADVQCGLYASAGGQPGHAAAWDSPDVNAQTGDFFRSTRRTMEHAFVRPRVAGHRRFQQLAGELIHGFIWSEDMIAAACLEEYGRLVDSLLADWGRNEGVAQ
jgi:multiple sugar transport system substrate-binding protein